MLGSRPSRLPRRSRTQAEGRTCEASDCSTKLSIYNAKPHCWQHTDIAFPNFRGKRLAKGTA